MVKAIRNREIHFGVLNNNIFRSAYTIDIPAEDFQTRSPSSQKLDLLVSTPLNAEMLLSLLIPRDRAEFVLGDLEEKFISVIVEKYGPRYAKFWYWGQVVVEGLAGIRAHLLNIAGMATLTKIVDWILKRRS